MKINVDFKHPTNQILLLGSAFLLMGACIVASIYISDTWKYLY